MSRLPIGVVNLLRGEPVPRGPSLRSACLPLNVAALLVTLAVAAPSAGRHDAAVRREVGLLAAGPAR